MADLFDLIKVPRVIPTTPSESPILNTESLREDSGETSIITPSSVNDSPFSLISIRPDGQIPDFKYDFIRSKPRTNELHNMAATESRLREFGAQPEWEHAGGWLRDWGDMYRGIWADDPDKWSPVTDVAGKVIATGAGTVFQGLGTVLGVGTSAPAGLYETFKNDDYRFFFRNLFNGRGWGELDIERKIRRGEIGDTIADDFIRALAIEIFADPLTYVSFGWLGAAKAIGKGGPHIAGLLKTRKAAKQLQRGVEYTLSAKGMREAGKFAQSGLSHKDSLAAVGRLIDQTIPDGAGNLIAKHPEFLKSSSSPIFRGAFAGIEDSIGLISLGFSGVGWTLGALPSFALKAAARPRTGNMLRDVFLHHTPMFAANRLFDPIQKSYKWATTGANFQDGASLFKSVGNADMRMALELAPVRGADWLGSKIPIVGGVFGNKPLGKVFDMTAGKAAGAGADFIRRTTVGRLHDANNRVVQAQVEGMQEALNNESPVRVRGKLVRDGQGNVSYEVQDATSGKARVEERDRILADTKLGVLLKDASSDGGMLSKLLNFPLRHLTFLRSTGNPDFDMLVSKYDNLRAKIHDHDRKIDRNLVTDIQMEAKRRANEILPTDPDKHYQDELAKLQADIINNSDFSFMEDTAIHMVNEEMSLIQFSRLKNDLESIKAKQSVSEKSASLTEYNRVRDKLILKMNEDGRSLQSRNALQKEIETMGSVSEQVRQELDALGHEFEQFVQPYEDLVRSANRLEEVDPDGIIARVREYDFNRFVDESIEAYEPSIKDAKLLDENGQLITDANKIEDRLKIRYRAFIEDRNSRGFGDWNLDDFEDRVPHLMTQASRRRFETARRKLGFTDINPTAFIREVFGRTSIASVNRALADGGDSLVDLVESNKFFELNANASPFDHGISVPDPVTNPGGFAAAAKQAVDDIEELMYIREIDPDAIGRTYRDPDVSNETSQIFHDYPQEIRDLLGEGKLAGERYSKSLLLLKSIAKDFDEIGNLGKDFFTTDMAFLSNMVGQHLIRSHSARSLFEEAKQLFGKTVSDLNTGAGSSPNPTKADIENKILTNDKVVANYGGAAGFGVGAVGYNDDDSRSDNAIHMVAAGLLGYGGIKLVDELKDLGKMERSIGTGKHKQVENLVVIDYSKKAWVDPYTDIGANASNKYGMYSYARKTKELMRSIKTNTFPINRSAGKVAFGSSDDIKNVNIQDLSNVKGIGSGNTDDISSLSPDVLRLDEGDGRNRTLSDIFYSDILGLGREFEGTGDSAAVLRNVTNNVLANIDPSIRTAGEEGFQRIVQTALRRGYPIDDLNRGAAVQDNYITASDLLDAPDVRNLLMAMREGADDALGKEIVSSVLEENQFFKIFAESMAGVAEEGQTSTQFNMMLHRAFTNPNNKMSILKGSYGEAPVINRYIERSRVLSGSLNERNDIIYKQYKNLWGMWVDQNRVAVERIRLAGYDLSKDSSGAYRLNLYNPTTEGATGLASWKPPIDPADWVDKTGNNRSPVLSGMILRTGARDEVSNMTGTHSGTSTGHVLMPENMIRKHLEETHPELNNSVDGNLQPYETAQTLYKTLHSKVEDMGILAASRDEDFQVAFYKLQSLGNAGLRQVVASDMDFLLQKGDTVFPMTIKDHMLGIHDRSPQGKLIDPSLDTLSSSIDPETGEILNVPSDLHKVSAHITLLQAFKGFQDDLFKNENWLIKGHERGDSVQAQVEDNLRNFQLSVLRSSGEDESFKLVNVKDISASIQTLEAGEQGLVVKLKSDPYTTYTDEATLFKPDVYGTTPGLMTIAARYNQQVHNVRNKWHDLFVDTDQKILAKSLRVHNEIVNFANAITTSLGGKLDTTSLVRESKRILYDMVKSRRKFGSDHEWLTALRNQDPKTISEPGNLYKVVPTEIKNVGRLEGLMKGPNSEADQVNMMLHNIVGSMLFGTRNMVPDATGEFIPTFRRIKYSEIEDFVGPDYLIDSMRAMDTAVMSQELMDVSMVNPKDIIGGYEDLEEITPTSMAAAKAGVAHVSGKDISNQLNSVITDATYGSSQGFIKATFGRDIKVGGVMPKKFFPDRGIETNIYSEPEETLIDIIQARRDMDELVINGSDEVIDFQHYEYPQRQLSQAEEDDQASDYLVNKGKKLKAVEGDRVVEEILDEQSTLSSIEADEFITANISSDERITVADIRNIADRVGDAQGKVSWDNLILDARDHLESLSLLNRRLREETTTQNMKKSDGTLVIIDQPLESIGEINPKTGKRYPSTPERMRMYGENTGISEDYPILVLDRRDLDDLSGGNVSLDAVRGSAMKIRSWIKDNSIKDLHVEGSLTYFSPGAHNRGEMLMSMILHDESFRTSSVKYARAVNAPVGGGKWETAGYFKGKDAVVKRVHGKYENHIPHNGYTGGIGFKSYEIKNAHGYTETIDNVNAQHLFWHEVVGLRGTIKSENASGRLTSIGLTPNGLRNTLFIGKAVTQNKSMANLDQVKGKPTVFNSKTQEEYKGYGLLEELKKNPDSFPDEPTDKLIEYGYDRPYKDLTVEEQYDVYDRWYQEVFDNMLSETLALPSNASREEIYKSVVSNYNGVLGKLAGISYVHGAMPTNPLNRIPKSVMTTFDLSSGDFQDPVSAFARYLDRNIEANDKLTFAVMKLADENALKEWSKAVVVEKIEPPALINTTMKDGKTYSYIPLPRIRSYLRELKQDHNMNSVFPAENVPIEDAISGLLKGSAPVNHNAVTLGKVGKGLDSDLFRMVASVAPHHRRALFGDDETFEMLKDMADHSKTPEEQKTALALMSNIGTDRMVKLGARVMFEIATGKTYLEPNIVTSFRDWSKAIESGQLRGKRILRGDGPDVRQANEVLPYSDSAEYGLKLMRVFFANLEGMHGSRMNNSQKAFVNNMLRKVDDVVNDSRVEHVRRSQELGDDAVVFGSDRILVGDSSGVEKGTEIPSQGVRDNLIRSVKNGGAIAVEEVQKDPRTALIVAATHGDAGADAYVALAQSLKTVPLSEFRSDGRSKSVVVNTLFNAIKTLGDRRLGLNARALISTRAGSKSEQDALSQLFGEEPKRLRPKPNINIESSGDADTDKVMPRFNVFSQQEEVIQSGNIEAAYEKALSDDGTAWDFSPLTDEQKSYLSENGLKAYAEREQERLNGMAGLGLGAMTYAAEEEDERSLAHFLMPAMMGSLGVKEYLKTLPMEKGRSKLIYASPIDQRVFSKVFKEGNAEDVGSEVLGTASFRYDELDEAQLQIEIGKDPQFGVMGGDPSTGIPASSNVINGQEHIILRTSPQLLRDLQELTEENVLANPPTAIVMSREMTHQADSSYSRWYDQTLHADDFETWEDLADGGGGRPTLKSINHEWEVSAELFGETVEDMSKEYETFLERRVNQLEGRAWNHAFHSIGEEVPTASVRTNGPPEDDIFYSEELEFTEFDPDALDEVDDIKADEGAVKVNVATPEETDEAIKEANKELNKGLDTETDELDPGDLGISDEAYQDMHEYVKNEIDLTQGIVNDRDMQSFEDIPDSEFSSDIPIIRREKRTDSVGEYSGQPITDLTKEQVQKGELFRGTDGGAYTARMPYMTTDGREVTVQMWNEAKNIKDEVSNKFTSWDEEEIDTPAFFDQGENAEETRSQADLQFNKEKRDTRSEAIKIMNIEDDLNASKDLSIEDYRILQSQRIQEFLHIMSGAPGRVDTNTYELIAKQKKWKADVKARVDAHNKAVEEYEKTSPEGGQFNRLVRFYDAVKADEAFEKDPDVIIGRDRIRRRKKEAAKEWEDFVRAAHLEAAVKKARHEASRFGKIHAAAQERQRKIWMRNRWSMGDVTSRQATPPPPDAPGGVPPDIPPDDIGGRTNLYQGKPLTLDIGDDIQADLPNSWVGPDGEVWAPVRMPNGTYLDDTLNGEVALFPQAIRQELERALGTMTNNHEMSRFVKLYDEVFGFYKKYTLFPFASYFFRNLLDSSLWKGWLMGNTDLRNYVKGMDLAKFRRAKGEEKVRLREKIGKVGGLDADQLESGAVEFGAIRDSVVSEEIGITNSNMLGHGGGMPDFANYLGNQGIGGKFKGFLHRWVDDAKGKGYERPTTVSAAGSPMKGIAEDIDSWLSDRGKPGKLIKKGLRASGSTVRAVTYPARTVLQKVTSEGMMANDFLEDSLRFSALVDGVGPKGLNLEQASERVKTYHFDYTDSSEFFKTVPSRLFPWINWTARNVPLHLRLKYGGSHHKFLPFYKGLDMWEASDPFGDSDNIDPKYMASFMRDNLPVRVGKDKDGNPTYLLMGMMFDTVEVDNMRLEDVGPMAVQMMSPMLRMPVEQLMNYDFLRRKQLARWSGETGEYFGVRMSSRAIRALREVRVINEAEKISDKPDQWMNYFTGKNLYSYNPARSERIHLNRGRSATSMHWKFKEWEEANESLGLPDDDLRMLKPHKAFKISREQAQLKDTERLIKYRLRKLSSKIRRGDMSKQDRDLLDEYEGALKQITKKSERLRSKIQGIHGGTR